MYFFYLLIKLFFSLIIYHLSMCISQITSFHQVTPSSTFLFGLLLSMSVSSPKSVFRYLLPFAIFLKIKTSYPLLCYTYKSPVFFKESSSPSNLKGHLASLHFIITIPTHYKSISILSFPFYTLLFYLARSIPIKQRQPIL